MADRLHQRGIYWGPTTKRLARPANEKHVNKHLFHTGFVGNDWNTGLHKKLFAIAPGCEPIDLNGYVVPNSSAIKGLNISRNYLQRRRNPYTVENLPPTPEPPTAPRPQQPIPPTASPPRQPRAPRTARAPGSNRSMQWQQPYYPSGSSTHRGPRAQSAPTYPYELQTFSPNFPRPRHNPRGEFVPRQVSQQPY